jgi:ABC-2 type transport system permease protein
MRALMIIIRRDFLNLLHKGSFVFNATLFPLALVGLLGLLNEGFFGREMTGWDVCAVNILVYMSAYSAMIATNSFMERTLRPTNLRVLFTPVPLPALYVGKILATTLFCGGGYLVDTVVLSLCGMRLGPALGLGLAPLVLAVTLASTSLGVFICCLVKDEPTANRILSLVVNLFAVVGGVFFSLESLGGTAARIASFSPFTWLREAAFRYVWDGRVLPMAVMALAALLVAALGMICCRPAFKPEDYV